MAWVKLDDAWYDHPKLVDADLAVVGLWVIGITYCNRYLTDGHITKAAVRKSAPSAKQAHIADLVRRGLWDVVEDGWQVHDYLDYQPSAATVKDQKRRRQEAGRLGGHSKQANAKANARAGATANAKQMLKPAGSTPSRPDPMYLHSEGTNEGELDPVDNAKKAREVRDHLRAVGE